MVTVFGLKSPASGIGRKGSVTMFYFVEPSKQGWGFKITDGTKDVLDAATGYSTSNGAVQAAKDSIRRMSTGKASESDELYRALNECSGMRIKVEAERDELKRRLDRAISAFEVSGLAEDMPRLMRILRYPGYKRGN